MGGEGAAGAAAMPALVAVDESDSDDEERRELDYHEDSAAEVDLNVVSASDGNLIEVQGAAEKKPFSQEQLNTMLGMANQACESIRDLQKKSLGI